MRLIDAAPMLEKIDLEHYDKDWYVSQYNADWISSWLDSQPVIEAEPVKHGRWERCFEDWRQQIEGDKCSACGFEHYGCCIKHYHYCPNCGAKMDLGG